MYAILFIPDASYLYHEIDHGAINHDKAAQSPLFTFQETIDPERIDQRFELAYFKSKKEIEKRFTETFWKTLSEEANYLDAAYIEYDNRKYELTDEKNRIYFEIVKVNNV